MILQKKYGISVCEARRRLTFAPIQGRMWQRALRVKPAVDGAMAVFVVAATDVSRVFASKFLPLLDCETRSSFFLKNTRRVLDTNGRSSVLFHLGHRTFTTKIGHIKVSTPYVESLDWLTDHNNRHG